MKETLKVTLLYLKRSKFYCLTILVGTTISILLISGVIMLYNNYHHHMEIQKANQGTWVLHGDASDPSTMKHIENDTTIHISKQLTIHDYGVFKIDTAYINIFAYDNFNDLKPVTLLEGTYPQNDKEILVSSDFVNALSYQIGDFLHEAIGNRYSKDGSCINQMETEPDEYFIKDEDKTFKITGIYEQRDPPDTAVIDQFITKADKKSESYDTYYAIEKVSPTQWDVLTKTYQGDHINTDVKNLYVKKSISSSDFIFYFIVFLVLGINLYLFTENIFQVYYQQKRHLIGQFESIGMSRRQILSMSLAEVALLSLIAIPLGLITSLAVLNVLFDVLNQWGMIKEISDFTSYQIILYGQDIIFIILMTILLLLCSSLIPLRSMLKETPIQLFHPPISAKKIKANHKPSWRRRPYSQPVLLAKRMLISEKKKYRSIKFTLSMGIIMVLCSGYIFQLMNQSTGMYDSSSLRVDTRTFHSMDDFQRVDASMQELMKLKEIDAIESAYYEIDMEEVFYDKKLIQEPYDSLEAKETHGTVTLLANMDDKQEMLSYENHDAILLESYKNDNDDHINIYDNELNKQNLTLTNSFVNGQNKLVDMQLSLHIRDILGVEAIGQKRNNLSFYSGNQILVSKDTFKDVYESHGLHNPHITVKSSHLILRTKQKNEVINAIRKIQKKYPYTIRSISDMQENIDKIIVMQRSISYMLAGFTVLTILIVWINFINVIVSNLMVKKKEYATFISLGMKHGQITAMLLYKHTTVVTTALFWGILFAQIINFIISKLLMATSFSIDFRYIIGVMITAYAISILAVLCTRGVLKDEECVKDIVQSMDT